MVDNLRSIFIGESNVGRSRLLISIANILYDIGYSICLVAGDGAGVDSDINRDILYLINTNDSRLFKMINQSNDIDIVLIDDIDYLSDESLSEVISSKKIIISNCHIYKGIVGFRSLSPIKLNEFISKSKIFNMTNKTIEFDNSIIDSESFLKHLKRDLKIKKVLNE